MTQCTILTLTVSKFLVEKHVFSVENELEISKFQIFDQHVLNDPAYYFDLDSFENSKFLIEKHVFSVENELESEL